VTVKTVQKSVLKTWINPPEKALQRVFKNRCQPIRMHKELLTTTSGGAAFAPESGAANGFTSLYLLQRSQRVLLSWHLLCKRGIL